MGMFPLSPIQTQFTFTRGPFFETVEPAAGARMRGAIKMQSKGKTCCESPKNQ